MIGNEPELQRYINETIESCVAAGIPAIKYSMSILGVLRTERTPGLGGSSYSTWKKWGPMPGSRPNLLVLAASRRKVER